MSKLQQKLDADGYALLSELLGRDELDALRNRVEELFSDEGDLAGAEFKQEPGSRRLANLVAKGSIFWKLLTHSRTLPLVQYILNHRAKLSSLNARSVNAGWPQAQPLHADMGALPDAQGYWVCNVVWMLDDFTADNGPLRIVPGSHRWRTLPQDALAHPEADHPEQIILTAKAGSAIILNAHVWHGGMPNHTTRSRTAIHAFYCRRDKPQQQYQKHLLPADLQQQLPIEVRTLLAIDDSQNDELAKQQTPRSGFLK